jgi:hypothetical protein
MPGQLLTERFCDLVRLFRPSQRPRGLSQELSSSAHAGIMDSNQTQSIDVCVRLSCFCVVLYVVSGLAVG